MSNNSILLVIYSNNLLHSNKNKNIIQKVLCNKIKSNLNYKTKNHQILFIYSHCIILFLFYINFYFQLEFTCVYKEPLTFLGIFCLVLSSLFLLCNLHISNRMEVSRGFLIYAKKKYNFSFFLYTIYKL